MTKIKDVSVAMTQFEASATEHARATEKGDPKAANRSHDMVVDARRPHRADNMAADQHHRQDVSDDEALHAAAAHARAAVALRVGRADRVKELLGRDFALKFDTGSTVLRLPSGEAVWEVFSKGYGPTKTLYQNAADRKEDLHRDFVAFHDAHRNADFGVAMPREYLVTVGTRR